MKTFGLSNIERLKSKKDFELIYSTGKTLYSKANKLKALFVVFENSENPGVKIGVAVSKRAGNAVWRNRLKRLLRESYRLNKHTLSEECIALKKSVYVVFSLNRINQRKNRNIKLSYIYDEVIDLVKQIRDRL